MQRIIQLKRLIKNKTTTMKKGSFILLLVMFTLFSTAMAMDKGFEDYANHQHELLNNAYEKHDVNVYGKLLGDFLEKYNHLNEADQKAYVGYLIDGYYNYSCTWALTGNKTMAISYLGKAIKAGYMDYSHISGDTDLDGIRGDAAFVALVQPLRKVGDYLYIIQKAGAYNKADNRPWQSR
jgi:hypothetical protein